MIKVYSFFKVIMILLLLTLSYDVFLYFTYYNELISYEDEICYLISKNGGINANVKEYIYSNNLEIEYEKSSDINGATFEFTVIKEASYLLSNNKHYIKLELTVILGYY